MLLTGATVFGDYRHFTLSTCIRRIALGVAALVCCWAAQAMPALVLDNARQSYPLGGLVEYSEDVAGQLDIQELMRLPQDAWHKPARPVLNFGFSPSTYWFRLALQSDAPQRWLLEIDYPLLDDVTLYTFDGAQLLQEIHIGDARPFADRPYLHEAFVMPLTLPQARPVAVYLRVQTTGAVQVPLRLWKEAAFIEQSETGAAIQGIYCGVVLVMIVYNLFLYIKIREPAYIYYVLFVLTFGLFTLGSSGWGYRYLWPQAVGFQQYNSAILMALSIIFATRFIHHFLDLRRNAPRIGQLLAGVSLFLVLLLVLLPLVGYHVAIQAALVMTLVSAVAALYAGILLWRRKQYTARYFTMAWGVFLLSTLPATLEKFGVLPSTFWADFFLPLGVILILGLLSFALGERINLEKQERIQAQQQIIRLKEKHQTELEQKIAERTTALEHANAALQTLATVDSLTGIFNRRHFLDRAVSEINIAKRHQRPIAVAMLDIDFFKVVNDTHGHDVGDKVLQHLVMVCSGVVRSTDVFGRLGGEEFGILLLETSPASAYATAERIRHEVERSPCDHRGVGIRVTVSLGVCAVETALQPVTIEQMLKVADNALYQAKHSGRNRVIVLTDTEVTADAAAARLG